MALSVRWRHDRLASSRNLVTNSPTQNLDEINLVLQESLNWWNLLAMVHTSSSFSSSQRRGEEDMRSCDGNNMATPSSVEKKGGGDAPSARAMILLQAMVTTLVKQTDPL